ncbi:HalOD1 output domain-containing protein [Haladaptatus caseinilyticus]|uniref:HalOD1 output domain-containing protein n=1 Tax=Haladaptatus caseinilyticus TaxID=2993314 RepID=UPI00224B3405|nr:HalOD1 output domain-containing protein [Haladaptatus caseinilyticus]
MDDSAEHESSIDDRPSIRVINAIAEHEGTTPTEIRPVLYDIIEPDALDSLFAETQHGESRADGHVTFQYGSSEVTVYSDGRVEIVQSYPGQSDESSNSAITTFNSSSGDN